MFHQLIQKMIHLWFSNAPVARLVVGHFWPQHATRVLPMHRSASFSRVFTSAPPIRGSYIIRFPPFPIALVSYIKQIRQVSLQDTRDALCRCLLQVTCSCRLSKAKPLKDCFGVFAAEWWLKVGVLLSISLLLEKGQGSSQSLLCADTTNSSINLGCQTATWKAVLFKGTLHINY